MIHYDKKLIFIHIPKCGGTSVENALFRPHEKTSDALFTLKGHPDHDKYETGGLQHLSASKVREVVGGKIYDEFYKFAVVRHPVKRLISQFNYTYQFPYFVDMLNLKFKNFTFREYLDAIRNKYHVHWRPQHEFIYDGNRLLVDKIYKMEDLKPLENDLDITLPHHNKSTKHITSISERDESIIKNIFEKDYELLEYV
tara:strand:- start:990 stop:1583 length:594 start_codon:yes stop_codon:yes gene_type:complete